MKKLIFFATTDPATAPGPIWSALHFAQAAARAGLDAEVRLAGDAVRIALDDGWAEGEEGAELHEKLAAGAGGGYAISMCPNSSRARSVSEEAMAAIGAAPRPLADVLTETADDRATLIYMG